VDFSFSEEQLAIRELASQILGNKNDPERLKQIEASEERFDRELWRELARANLLGTAIPETAGGMGFGIQELLLLLEEQGRTLALVPLHATLVLAAAPLARFGSEAQRDRWLAKIAAGDLCLSAALEELGSSDPARPGCRALPEAGSFLLEGEKVCVPYAHVAERVLVPATCEGKLGLYWVDPHGAGVELELQDTVNHEAHFLMHLDGARSDECLGDPASAGQILAWILEHAQLSLAALQLGIAQEALRRTAVYTSERKQFGKPIGSFQGVSLRAADSYIAVEAMRSTLWQASWRLSEGLPASREVAVAKWWACRGAHEVVHTAQHLHGGTGADIDYPIHRFFYWSTQIENTLGGATQQLSRLGGLLAQA